MSIHRMATVTSTGGIDSYTKLMLHCDGTNGSTTFTDTVGKTVTKYGTAQISTAQYKFNGSSGLFDGTGDYLTIPHSTDFEFGSEDFSIDCWVRPSNISASQFIACEHNYGTLGSYYLTITSTGKLMSYLYYSSNSNVQITSDASLTLNEWNHVFVGRTNGVMYLGLNGTVKSAALTQTLVNPNTVFTIGEQTNGSNYYAGYLDEFRISKGICRWNANFTPPTAPYSIDAISTNVNVPIVSQYRGLSGVNRTIKSQYRGYSGVNRLVFGKAPYMLIADGIMQNGKTLAAGYESSTNLLATISYPAGYVNVAGYNNYRGGVYVTGAIDLTDYSVLGVELEYTKGNSDSAFHGLGNCSVSVQTSSPLGGLGNSLGATTKFLAEITEEATVPRMTVSVDISSLSGNYYLDLLYWNSVYALSSPTYPVSGKIYNAWLE